MDHHTQNTEDQIANENEEFKQSEGVYIPPLLQFDTPDAIDTDNNTKTLLLDPSKFTVTRTPIDGFTNDDENDPMASQDKLRLKRVSDHLDELISLVGKLVVALENTTPGAEGLKCTMEYVESFFKTV